MKRTPIYVITLVALCAGLASAGPNDPIVGEAFDALLESQQSGGQAWLEELYLPFGDSLDIVVSGPLSGHNTPSEEYSKFFGPVRIVCADLLSRRIAAVTFPANVERQIEEMASHISTPLMSYLPGFRGTLVRIVIENKKVSAVLTTANQNRFMIWASTKDSFLEDQQRDHALAVSDYLYSLDTGWMEAPAPTAVDYGLPDSMDFYAPPPDYVIEGYDNYLNFLNAHDTIRLDFANGLTEFIPTDSLWDAMKANAPRAAWPNKEWPMLQHEYKKFFDRGGDVRVMQTLTSEGFDTLRAGEYFFAVSVAGKIRFGRELLREEVNRIEAETGKKVPRANHAFLFPGEPVLTAGAFFIEATADTKDSLRLSHINAQSGHYFYSNVSPTIREDISIRSDEYLTTLGHFFKALDSLGIPHDNVVISKL